MKAPCSSRPKSRRVFIFLISGQKRIDRNKCGLVRSTNSLSYNNIYFIYYIFIYFIVYNILLNEFELNYKLEVHWCICVLKMMKQPCRNSRMIVGVTWLSSFPFTEMKKIKKHTLSASYLNKVDGFIL